MEGLKAGMGSGGWSSLAVQEGSVNDTGGIHWLVVFLLPYALILSNFWPFLPTSPLSGERRRLFPGQGWIFKCTCLLRLSFASPQLPGFLAYLSSSPQHSPHSTLGWRESTGSWVLGKDVCFHMITLKVAFLLLSSFTIKT